MSMQRPLRPHPNRRMIVLESVGAVLAVIAAVTWAVLGVPWFLWASMVGIGASSAMVAWATWKGGR